MKFQPQFPSLQSIAQTIALAGVLVAGIEIRHYPRFGTTLIIVAVALFWVASKFLKPKNQKSTVKTENYHIT